MCMVLKRTLEVSCCGRAEQNQYSGEHDADAGSHGAGVCHESYESVQQDVLSRLILRFARFAAESRSRQSMRNSQEHSTIH